MCHGTAQANHLRRLQARSYSRYAGTCDYASFSGCITGSLRPLTIEVPLKDPSVNSYVSRQYRSVAQRALSAEGFILPQVRSASPKDSIRPQLGSNLVRPSYWITKNPTDSRAAYRSSQELLHLPQSGQILPAQSLLYDGHHVARASHRRGVFCTSFYLYPATDPLSLLTNPTYWNLDSASRTKRVAPMYSDAAGPRGTILKDDWAGWYGQF